MPDEYTEDQLYALWLEERAQEERMHARMEADEYERENETYNWNLNS